MSMLYSSQTGCVKDAGADMRTLSSRAGQIGAWASSSDNQADRGRMMTDTR